MEILKNNGNNECHEFLLLKYLENENHLKQTNSVALIAINQLFIEVQNPLDSLLNKF